MAASNELQQISLSLSGERGMLSSATSASLARQERDAHTVSQGVYELNNGNLAPFALQNRLSPFNICATSDFLAHVRHVHRCLDKALIDIVDRWFVDATADFARRMPLQKHEEDLLRWIDGPGKSAVPPFESNYGMWRTDYLIERDPSGRERVKICEINARIPYNGFWVVGYHEMMTSRLNQSEKQIRSPNDFEATREAMFSCFDRHKPVYYIRDKWPGVDGPAFARDFELATGQLVRLAAPSELQVRPDDKSPTGHSLYHVLKSSEDAPQKVDQCTLELFQEEYQAMDPLLLRQIATSAVNDLRNVFLVHDKRILGIILEELPRLASRNILTEEECSALKDAIADTLLPGTDGVRELLRRSQVDETVKDSYIVKPVRDASGNGIRPGSLLSQSDWLAILRHHADHELTPDDDACVIQRLVQHVQYDIVRHGLKSTSTEKFHLIGSQHMINSKLSVHGPWRLGNDRGHLGLSGPDPAGRGIVMSTVVKPENWQVLTEKEED